MCDVQPIKVLDEASAAPSSRRERASAADDVCVIEPPAAAGPTAANSSPTAELQRLREENAKLKRKVKAGGAAAGGGGEVEIPKYWRRSGSGERLKLSAELSAALSCDDAALSGGAGGVRGGGIAACELVRLARECREYASVAERFFAKGGAPLARARIASIERCVNPQLWRA